MFPVVLLTWMLAQAPSKHSPSNICSLPMVVKLGHHNLYSNQTLAWSPSCPSWQELKQIQRPGWPDPSEAMGIQNLSKGLSQHNPEMQEYKTLYGKSPQKTTGDRKEAADELLAFSTNATDYLQMQCLCKGSWEMFHMMSKNLFFFPVKLWPVWKCTILWFHFLLLWPPFLLPFRFVFFGFHPFPH